MSPDKSLMLKNVDADSEQERTYLGDYHALYLESSRTGAEKKIYTYPRSVQVTWSPDSAHLAINDFDASNHATCQVVSVAGGAITNVEAAIKRKFAHYHPELGASHLYVTATRWASNTLLEVRASGYGLSSGRDFTHTYVYDLATRQACDAADTK